MLWMWSTGQGFSVAQLRTKRTLFLFRDALSVPASSLRSSLSGQEFGWNKVVATSATIFDLGAYRARKRTALESALEPDERAPAVAPIGFYFFWPVLACMPIGFLLTGGGPGDFA